MIKTRTTRIIEVSDFDQLVKTTYGKPYSLQQQDDCKDRGVEHITVPEKWADDYENDTLPETTNHEDMGVSFAAWLARDPNQKLNADDWDSPSAIPMWWERNFYPSLGMIVNDLHAKGLLEAGDYTIEIDW